MKQKEINKKNKSYVGADDPVRPLSKRNPLIKQNGITVVALVITIIIMLILAGVTVKIATGGGIIDKTKNASNEFEIEQEKEKVKSGYLSYKTAKMVDDNAQLFVEDAQPPIGNATSGWTVIFTKTNNEYKLTKDGKVTLTKQGNGSTTTLGWTDNGNDTFTKEDVTVKLGDIVSYDEGKDYSTTVDKNKSGYSSNQTFKTDDLNWRVLGINSKGELELISDNPTSGLTLCYETGYLNAEEVLNNMCNELYGQGTYATGARSLNVENINKLGNYDPTTYSGYGDIWTHRFPTSGDYIQYKRIKTDGTLVTDWTDVTGASQTFRMPGEAKKETISVNNRNDTGKSLEDTYYYYIVVGKVKQTTSDGKKMSDVISNGTGSSDVTQWLASRCIQCCDYGALFWVRTVDMAVGNIRLYNSNGISGSHNYCVRPVVTLESDIQLSGNSNDGWTIN